MSKANRKAMYDQIKDDPIRLKASGLAEEFEKPKPVKEAKAEPKGESTVKEDAEETPKEEPKVEEEKEAAAKKAEEAK